MSNPALALDPLSAIADAVEHSPTLRSPNKSPSPHEQYIDETPRPPPRFLYAISDLHLSYKHNREALERLKPHPNCSLILAGDVGESPEHLHFAFAQCKACFDEVYWCPGNHELYTLPTHPDDPRGEKKYEQCVAIAREHRVWTPEDEFQIWADDEGRKCLICPIFTLYDYSFRPDEITGGETEALKWAKEEGLEATDQHLLHPDPYPSRSDWCMQLVSRAEKRLQHAVSQHPSTPLIITAHWPLRHDLVHLPSIPRFSIWCGTKATEDWHTRFNAKVVVTGHLHIRRTDWRDGVRFEEVSLGYPRQWKECEERGLGVNDMLREILPGPEPPPTGCDQPTKWRRYG
jgi:predicted phosphodiesterase